MQHIRQDKLILSPQCEELFIDNRLQAGLCEFEIELGGISLIRGRYYVSKYQCKYHTLIYTRSGQGLLTTASGAETVVADSWLILPAGSSFSYELEPDKHWDIVWYLINDVADWQCLKRKGKRLMLNQNSIDSIFHISMALYNEVISTKPLINIVSLTAQLLNEHIRRDLQAHSHLTNTARIRVDALFLQLSTKLQQSWDLPALAKLSGYSVAQFNRICQRELKLSPMKKLRQLRMARAQALLKSTELNLSDIASALAYKDVFNFSSAFKREIGIAPSEYRNS